MFVNKLVCTKINKFCQKLKFKRFFGTKPDAFSKSQENNIPTKLKKIFDSHKYYDKYDKEVITALYNTGEKKFNIIYNDKETFGMLWFPFCRKEFIKAVDKLSEKELKQSIKEIKDLYTSLPKVNYGKGEVLQQASSSDVANLIILKTNKPETYNYLINNPNKILVSLFLSKSNNFHGSLFETLTIPQIRQVIGIGRDHNISIKTDRDLINNGWAAM